MTPFHMQVPCFFCHPFFVRVSRMQFAELPQYTIAYSTRPTLYQLSLCLSLFVQFQSGLLECLPRWHRSKGKALCCLNGKMILQIKCIKAFSCKSFSCRGLGRCLDCTALLACLLIRLQGSLTSLIEKITVFDCRDNEDESSWNEIVNTIDFVGHTVSLLENNSQSHFEVWKGFSRDGQH